MDIKKLAREAFPYAVALRRDFHRHPEPSFEEFRTTARIAEELDGMGIPYRRFEPTGLVAEIKGGRPGRRIFLRADIDALSVREEGGVEFASETRASCTPAATTATRPCSWPRLRCSTR